MLYYLCSKTRIFTMLWFKIPVKIINFNFIISGAWSNTF